MKLDISCVVDINNQNKFKLNWLPIVKNQDLDLYFFGIDLEGKLGHDDVSDKDIIDSLLKLLSSWVDCAENIVLGGEFYMILDFSDQYIGGFRVYASENGQLRVTYGCTQEYCGSSIYPSQCTKLTGNDIDSSKFLEDENELFLSKTELNQELQNCIGNVRQASWPKTDQSDHWHEDTLI